jgi:2-keto-4-pentenoate hydratase
VSATTADIAAAVSRLQAAADTATPCAPVRDLLGMSDIDAAYLVQKQLAETRVHSGVPIAGRKIGLTALAVQQQFGVYRPDFGLLFADMIYSSSEPIPVASLLQPRVEAEVAFVLGRDIDNPNATITDVLRATDFVLAAIEVVDSRIAGWDIRITDTVADNASSGAVVLGTTPYSLTGLDLSAVTMTMTRDGETLSSGTGAACMGSPVTAMAWLAREVARRGRPLRAGEVVLSGALGAMVSVGGSGVYRADIAGLGRVDASFRSSEDS